MSLRLDLAKEHERKVRKELGKLRIKPEVGEYSEQDKIAEFYELGSRWAEINQEEILDSGSLIGKKERLPGFESVDKLLPRT